jgi:hypothetical protein
MDLFVAVLALRAHAIADLGRIGARKVVHPVSADAVSRPSLPGTIRGRVRLCSNMTAAARWRFRSRGAGPGRACLALGFLASLACNHTDHSPATTDLRFPTASAPTRAPHQDAAQSPPKCDDEELTRLLKPQSSDRNPVCQDDMSTGFGAVSDQPAYYCTLLGNARSAALPFGVVARCRADAYWGLQAKLCMRERTAMTVGTFNRRFTCKPCSLSAKVNLPACPSDPLDP